jgi:hypothetical protein
MKNRELYTHVFEYEGQACVCISKVRKLYNEYVAVYDLDAGEIYSHINIIKSNGDFLLHMLVVVC